MIESQTRTHQDTSAGGVQAHCLSVYYEVYPTSPLSRLLSISLKTVSLIAVLGPSVSFRPCLY